MKTTPTRMGRAGLIVHIRGPAKIKKMIEGITKEHQTQRFGPVSEIGPVIHRPRKGNCEIKRKDRWGGEIDRRGAWIVRVRYNQVASQGDREGIREVTKGQPREWRTYPISPWKELVGVDGPSLRERSTLFQVDIHL